MREEASQAQPTENMMVAVNLDRLAPYQGTAGTNSLEEGAVGQI
jgi:hypothetical protein